MYGVSDMVDFLGRGKEVTSWSFGDNLINFISGQSFFEAGYQMKPTLESKLQVVVQKIASSSIYYLILMWLLKTFLFLLWIGKCVLIWVLRLSFWLLRRYFSVALVALTLSSTVETNNEASPSAIRRLEWIGEEERADTHNVDDPVSSPLMPKVVQDHVQICEENLAIKDRERLLFEFEKIFAPQVSAFQLGEIIVPANDTRQLATFLKLKLSQTCSASHSAINATVCESILNINQSEGAVTRCVESWERIDPSGNIKHAIVYIAVRLDDDGKVHLVLVGRKVEEFLGSSEFRSRFNPPRTRGDEKEWESWTWAHSRELRESAVRTAEELLSFAPVHAQVW